MQRTLFAKAVIVLAFVGLLTMTCASDAATGQTDEMSQIRPEKSDIDDDEHVVFFPTAAFLERETSTWIVPVHGIIYEPERHSLRRDAFAVALRKMLKVQPDTREARLLDERVRLFLVDNERGQQITVRIGSKYYTMSPSTADGHFEGRVRLTPAALQSAMRGQNARKGLLGIHAVTRRQDKRSFAGRVQVIGPTGLSVISDIDDTVKHSQVGNKREILANTFLRPFKPVMGMPELYRQCAAAGMAFHYVSGSPWQLYLPLAEFLRDEQLPFGSFHLKLFRLKDPQTSLAVLCSQVTSKPRMIKPILKAYPSRRFVLIGDSGEQDPEIYAAIAAEFKEQIAGIFIRNVTGEALDNARFEAIQKGIANVHFRLFDRPEEIRPVMQTIIDSQGCRCDEPDA
jgi:hypothetical protein